MLIVLDGWGLSDERAHNAVVLAETPVMDALIDQRPYASLVTSGRAVGLPDGQMGNSEVGHLNLGAGRVVDQDIVRIDRSIETGDFFELPPLVDCIQKAKKLGGAMHVIGLVSDGGVHSLQDHGVALARLGRKIGIERIFAHAFTDGRDTPPRSGLEFVGRYAENLRSGAGAELATVIGRYYAMDRDRRWERSERAFRAMVTGEGFQARSAAEAIEASYAKGVTDEFIEPVVLIEDGRPVGQIRDGDAVICMNFRADRVRQITRAFTDEQFDGFDVSGRPSVHYACMTEYDERFGLPVAFPPLRMEGLFCHALADAGKTCLRVAETEKYPHVTYFFNGGEEEPPPGERRHMVPSPKVATYDLKPEMSAGEVTEVVLDAIEQGDEDAIVLNYANPDMVGHTGVESAAVRAAGFVDACLGRVLEALEAVGGAAVVTADHGNCETMWDVVNDCPHTAHTLNETPCIVVAPGFDVPLRSGGALCDVAPTLLGLMGISPTPEMTGVDLRVL
ncbi:MAG: 2,3-bisphosphoglycerate-independent phosphoglycerate mutase [Nitrospinae bacterium]|nr:2,3-bisphosphoglycerate-independent phosphoglycerate mutase [Nitrospinota bacterium]